MLFSLFTHFVIKLSLGFELTSPGYDLNTFTSLPDKVKINYNHATILHLLGLDHERLTYYHNGIDRRLTDVHGDVIRAVLS